jgi:hypothetical protein
MFKLQCYVSITGFAVKSTTANVLVPVARTAAAQEQPSA